MQQNFLTDGPRRSMSDLDTSKGNFEDVEAELSKGPTKGLESHTRLRPKHLFAAVYAMEPGAVGDRGV